MRRSLCICVILIVIIFQFCGTQTENKPTPNIAVDETEDSSMKTAVQKFSDERIDIEIKPLVYSINYTITNRTKKPIKLLISESVIIDDEGFSHRVWQEGKLIESTKPQPDVMIAPDSKIRNQLLPTDTLEFESEIEARTILLNNNYWPLGDNWYVEGIFYPTADNTLFNYSVMFMIEIEGVRYYSTIMFRTWKENSTMHPDSIKFTEDAILNKYEE